MQRVHSRLNILVTMLIILSCATSYTAVNEYKKNSPLFYAALAGAVYERHKLAAQKNVDKILKKDGKSDSAQVLAMEEYTHLLFGQTTFIAAKDKHNALHVAVEGSDEIRNWLGNALAPINGFFHNNDVPEGIRNDMHRIIKNWTRKYGKLSSLVGHSRGGMFSSQIASSKKDFYRETQVITFNGYKIKSGKNQLHLLAKNEHVASTMSSSGRYVRLPIGSGGHLRIITNHSIDSFLSGLQNKDWQYIERYK